MAIKSCEIDGLDQLIKDLGQFGTKAMPALQAAAITAGDVVLVRARKLAPVGSNFERGWGDDIKHEPGTLKRSLKLMKKKLKAGDMVTYSRITFGKDAAYAVPLELGHNVRNVEKGPVLGNVEARPFLRPAADQSKEAVTDIIVATMNREIERLGDK